MTTMSPPHSPRKPCASSAGSIARWRQDPEVRLMLRVRDGDAAAFIELEKIYRSRVLGWFCRRLGDRNEAEDLTQEVFLRLYRARASYRPNALFSTWVFHIAQNVARNALRSRRRRPCMQLEMASAPSTPAGSWLPDRAEPPSRRLENAELTVMVRAAVAELGGRQRAAVELHQFDDMTYTEVAAELDMTPKAAKSLLYRARNQLRVSLAAFVK
jgi:RNA polymerase sigma-70 factor, ECF subfamily